MSAIDLTHPLRPVRIPLPLKATAAWRNFVRRTLPMRWTIWTASQSARLDMILRPGRRRQLLNVLRSVGPEPADDRTLNRCLRLARAVRRLGGHSYAPVSGRSREWLLTHLRPQGLEHLDAVRAAGSGAVIVGAHAGLNGWVGPVLRQLGYPLCLTQRRHTTVDIYLLLKRDGMLPHVLAFPEPGEGGPHLKRYHDMLRQGAWLQHVGDFPAEEGGVRGTYMGRPVLCVSAPWRLARLARVPVVPVLLLVDQHGGSRMAVCPPIYLEPATSPPEGLEGPFQAYLDFVSGHLRRQPWNVGLKHWQKLFGRSSP